MSVCVRLWNRILALAEAAVIERKRRSARLSFFFFSGVLLLLLLGSSVVEVDDFKVIESGEKIWGASFVSVARFGSRRLCGKMQFEVRL